jgi:hypothetical protein
MCIGFSVDFSAHISYHFLAAKNASPEERIRSSLKAFGTPIIQVTINNFFVNFVLCAFASSDFCVFFTKLNNGCSKLQFLSANKRFLASKNVI